MKTNVGIVALILSIAATSISSANAQTPTTSAGAGSQQLNLLLEQQRSMIEAQERQLHAQQQQMDEQRSELSMQKTLLLQMQARVDALAGTPPTPEQPNAVIRSEEITAPISSGSVSASSFPSTSASEDELRLEVATLTERLETIPEDPLAAIGDERFPGAIRLPGTNASMKIGGFVKAGFVKSFDPLASTDRFIVGSIPVGGATPGVEEQTSFTANQSRLNLEFRDKTSLGDLRAFFEGDFARSGDTFRLRHAYGQYLDFLTGQTWTTFYDPQAWPEEVDFEGLNGGTILRQAQVRWFPSIAKNWGLQIALEDPVSKVSEIDLTGSPDVGDPNFNTNFGNEIRAKGLTDLPDVIATIRRQWFGRWHLKTAFVLHQVKGQYSQRPDLPDRHEMGWGIAESGVLKAPWLDPRDNVKFQLILGDGISRYVNDTNSIGGLDGVFTPDGSKIKTLPIIAGYIAYQHWWGQTLRSNFIVSGVEIDNKDFQPDNAYKRTVRASTNMFWSPTPRLDLAIEYLWGKRTNKNGDADDASQIQLISKYGF